MANRPDRDEQYDLARRRVEAQIGFFVHLTVYLVINIIFLIVVGKDFLWATVFWGLGVAVHGVSVYLRNTGKLDQWKDQMIERDLARQRGETPAPARNTAAEPAASATVSPAAPAAPPPSPSADADPTVETTKPAEVVKDRKA